MAEVELVVPVEVRDEVTVLLGKMVVVPLMMEIVSTPTPPIKSVATLVVPLDAELVVDDDPVPVLVLVCELEDVPIASSVFVTVCCPVKVRYVPVKDVENVPVVMVETLWESVSVL